MSDARIVDGDFWISSGHHLLDRDGNGRLVATDEYLKLYLARPEIRPPDDACLVERGLHARLVREPRAPVGTREIADIADRDARENWRHLISFRDHVLAHPSLEAAYVALARAKSVTIPPLFLTQLVHVILRNALDGETDGFRLRAAEMLYRPQRLTVRDGIMLLADEERVDGTAVVDHSSPLVAMFGDARARDLDVLGTANVADYWRRSDAHDFVIDFRFGQPARSALAAVMTAWIRHLVGVDVRIAPLERVDERNWKWFIGLDQEATRIGNALWRGDEPPDDGLTRIVALFRLDIVDSRAMLERVAGEPVYLIMAMTPERIVRLKPQNLVAGLPLKPTQ